MTTKPLTAREARFVEQYRLHGNAARAAREAGYAAHQAKAIGWNVLRKPKIIAALRAHGIEIVLAPKKPGQPRNYARAYKRQGLTLLQERFVHQYLIDGNATQAAIRAGLPSRNPARAGSQMLHHREVAQAIERERAAAAARLSITADRVKNELAAIAFATIADVADWGPEGVELKDKSTLSPHDRAAIAELSSSRVEENRRGQDACEDAFEATGAGRAGQASGDLRPRHAHDRAGRGVTGASAARRECHPTRAALKDRGAEEGVDAQRGGEAFSFVIPA